MDPTEAARDPTLLPCSGNIKVPSGAELLFPRNIGPRIFAVHEKKQLLKAGPSVKMSEAEAMRFVARETQIPVPKVFESYVEDGNGYILMSRLEGEPLGEIWARLSPELRSAVVTQLKEYLKELSSVHGDFYGALWHQPSEDIFFAHLPFKSGAVSYGPYYSRQQYNEGLVRALENSGPTTVTSLDGLDEGLVDRLVSNNEDTKVFSHGDLQPMNILVDRSSGRVTGIVDWESAGFSIRGREYYEAKTRARNNSWAIALDDIFCEAERVHFGLLQQLDRALTRYTLV